MSIPIFSIVMPLYNKAGEVLRAVASVRTQTFHDWELIIVNDGSTDDGPEQVNALEDPRIRVIDQDNAGVSAARNRGFRGARANLIAFLDADDEWTPDFLETIFALWTRFPDCAVFATSYWIRRPDGVSFRARIRMLPRHFESGILVDYFNVASHSDPPLWTSAVAASRQALETVGGFLVGTTLGEDLLTWAQLATRFRIAYSMRTCAYFYMSGIDRIPDEPDRVGTTLTELCIANPQISHLPRYVAKWYRMRMVMFLRYGEQSKARAAFDQMARFSTKDREYLACWAASHGPRWFYQIGVRIMRYLAYMRKGK